MKKLLVILLMSFTAMGVYAQSGNGIAISSSLEQKKVTISPNPAVADINLLIEGTQFNVKTISIYSIIGNEVMTKNFNSNTKNIALDVRSLKKGKYHIRVIFEDNSVEVATWIKH
ncbi:MAG TPA: T9SS type A sorting domain-containing protein [Moheibacter sp.]|nr:T9SS type A sorting domain-containing protein [Moheibacter sp.]